MHKLSKNRTFLIVLVAIMILGLVAVYVPFLFSPAPLHREPAERPQGASLRETVLPSPTSTLPAAPSPTSSVDIPAPEGFSGLSEENQILDELDSLLGN